MTTARGLESWPGRGSGYGWRRRANGVPVFPHNPPIPQLTPTASSAHKPGPAHSLHPNSKFFSSGSISRFFHLRPTLIALVLSAAPLLSLSAHDHGRLGLLPEPPSDPALPSASVSNHVPSHLESCSCTSDV